MSGSDRTSDGGTGSDGVEPLSVWCAGEKWCPLTSTAALLGKKWHPVIVHRLVEEGPMGFNDLKGEVDGISSKVLSDNLEALEEKRIVDREVVSEKPFRVRYSLTEHGRSLEEVIDAMAEWGREHLEEAPDRDSAVV